MHISPDIQNTTTCPKEVHQIPPFPDKMSDFLNTEAIRSAAELINTTLIAKGFITDDLLFPTVDWELLTKEQPEKDNLAQLKPMPIIYNNDKNIINLLYSLTQSLDRHTAQQKELNESLNLKDKTIQDLRQKIVKLELRATASEVKLERSVRVEQMVLEDRVKQLSRQNRAHTQEITRLRNWNMDLQGKFEVELRKKAFEISLLKDKLLDTRNLSTTINYGKPFKIGNELGGFGGSGGPAGGSPTLSSSTSHSVNTNGIFDNKPVENVATQLELTPGDASLSPVVQQEYDQIAAHLSELVESLIRENSKYVIFCRVVSDYFNGLNSKLANPTLTEHSSAVLPNPAQVINLLIISEEAVDEVNPFEAVSAPLVTKLRENYDCILGLVAIFQNTVAAETHPKNTNAKEAELERLKVENQDLRDNLKEAMGALDGWKEYKQKRQN